MNTNLQILDDAERSAATVAMAFLRDRLESRSTIEWALSIRPNERAKKAALAHLLFMNEGGKLAEPWRTAWRLVEEFWVGSSNKHDEAIAAVRAKERILAGERTGSLIDYIVDIVSPRLKLEPRNAAQTGAPQRRRPRLEDLFRASLVSHDLVTFEQLGLQRVHDTRFLTDLVESLNAAVENGLSIARRIGWDGATSLWRLGFLYRVDYVPRRDDAGDDIDRFHNGIVSAVKLLNATVTHLANQDPAIGSRFARRWIEAADPIHLRLWSAVSRNRAVTSAIDVGAGLISFPPRVFWNLHDFPEVAELRAVRFPDLESVVQTKVLRRIRKGPPAALWPKGTLPADLARYRAYWSARELRRIEIAGGVLPLADKLWLRDALGDFPDLSVMGSLDHGFLEAGTGGWVAPSPDRQFDTLHGLERLEALEVALGASRVSWENDPSERANDWIREGTNASSVLADLDSCHDNADRFPLVLERLGWAHGRRSTPSEGTHPLDSEARTFISLIAELRSETLKQAISGISFWLSTWDDAVTTSPHFYSLWAKLWPLAVAATNAVSTTSDDTVLRVVGRTDDDDDRTSLDTLNTPAGRLVGLFLAACPAVQAGDTSPFESPPLSRMRDELVSTEGRAGLIAKHRLIEGLSYFLRTDADWARKHLIAPLEANDSSSLALWRAIARRTQFEFVLLHIGSQMAERAADLRLARETRSSLLSSLVLEPLHALLANRESVVSNARVQQAIRTVEDEVRARGANMVTRFLKEVGAKGDGSTTPDQIFRRAVAPFLRTVWPQERSLATPGVSAAWADLPAAAGDAFADAVGAIEHFLVPFSCWSMADYGLWQVREGSLSLNQIDDSAKASALLKLLDATVGSAEGAIVPYDLPDALRHLREISPELSTTPSFKRLSVAARGR